MDHRIIPTERDFFVGKCETCVHSIGLAWTDMHIGCKLHGESESEPSMVHRNWSCGRYDYEPGTTA